MEVQSFQQEQRVIDRGLQAVKASEETRDAARQIQATMDRLQRLEVAKGYVELIQLVHHLRYIFEYRSGYILLIMN